MARLKGAFQADNGDELYPHTSSDIVFCADGRTAEEKLNESFRGTNEYGNNVFKSSDLNDWNKIGSYSVVAKSLNTPGNYPSNDNWGTVTITGNGNCITQSYVPWNYTKYRWERSCRNGVWSPWDKSPLNRETVSYADGDALGYRDARGGGSLAPSEYSGNKRRGLNLQLQDRNNLDLSSLSKSQLVHLLTTHPWSDPTAGVRQIAMGAFHNQIFVRGSSDSSNWDIWAQVATVEENAFLVTPVSGVSIAFQKNYKVTDKIYVIEMEVSFTNGTCPVGSNTQIGTLPITARRCALTFAGMADGTTKVSGTAMCTDARVFLSPGAYCTGALVTGLIIIQ